MSTVSEVKFDGDQCECGSGCSGKSFAVFAIIMITIVMIIIIIDVMMQAAGRDEDKTEEGWRNVEGRGKAGAEERQVGDDY